MPCFRFFALAQFAILLLTQPIARAEDPFTSARRFVAANFQGKTQDAAAAPILLTPANWKPTSLLKDSIKGHKLLIAGRTFEHGLAMRSPGEIKVVIPQGARTFEAVIGVDSNDVGYYSNAGRGNVVATIKAGDKLLYQSPVLHEGTPAIPLRLDLASATDLTLGLQAVGPHSGAYQAEWDQADWADASMIASDDARIALSQLPVDPPPAFFSATPAPFSFRYDGKPSRDLLPAWHTERHARPLDQDRTEYTSLYSDHETGLSVRCVAVAYRDFPTVEWTMYLKNESQTPTAILDSVQPLDLNFVRGKEGEFILHHSRGSAAAATDYQPLQTLLKGGAAEHLHSHGGRPTNGDMPYFNLAWPGHSVLLALGWPGQWQADFARDGEQQIHVTGKQETTSFRLLPGEEIRTPLVVIQFSTGSWIDAQNVWRRWMLAHNLPRPAGHLPPPQLSAASAHFTVEMLNTDTQNQLDYLDLYLAAHLPIDHWWMDAGWYPNKGGWAQTGTWEPDPKRFPRGLAPITSAAHAHGIKSILWFEPERATPDSWLAVHHPEWLIGSSENRLLYLGNADALHWLIDHTSNLITTQGIDVYRQDFNFEPEKLWRSHDAPDRQGITEIRHVEGYLAYFDALQKRFPALMIDTCASGGGRLDLETLRRAVPLWRSDYAGDPAAMQMQTYGMALWIPYFGTSADVFDTYQIRSQMTPAMGIGLKLTDVPKVDAQVHQRLAEWRDTAPFFFADFYPLTEYSTEETAWMAWQWNRPQTGDGMIQAFRRKDSPYSRARYRLNGLDPNARYSVRNLNAAAGVELTGSELMETGLPVEIEGEPGASLITYQRVRKNP